MTQDNFDWHASLASLTGRHLADVRIEPDFVPAVRCAEFEQALQCDAALQVVADSAIEPVWSEQPWVRGIRVRTLVGDVVPVEFPLTYFATAVTRASASLVDSGVLSAGQRFDYKVYAFAKRSSPRGFELEVSHVATLPTVAARAIAPLLAAAEPTSQASSVMSHAAADEPMPVFIPEHVLTETTKLAAKAGEFETGGILVGKLYRDAGGTAFAEVTAQLPAEHTVATRESLRFTPQTWACVDAAIRLRKLEEIVLGWWHHHPFFCRHCPASRRALCPFSTPTFSAADRDVHREVFQNPWNVALLLSFLGGERPSYDVFTWQRGQIEAAGFYVLPRASLDQGGNHDRQP